MSTPSLRTPSFFTRAAWFSLIAPPIATGIALAIFLVEGDTLKHRIGDPAITAVLYISIAGLALGVASLCGVRKHGGKAILWKAVVGIVVSCFCGIYAALGLVPSH